MQNILLPLALITTAQCFAMKQPRSEEFIEKWHTIDWRASFKLTETIQRVVPQYDKHTKCKISIANRSKCYAFVNWFYEESTTALLFATVKRDAQAITVLMDNGAHSTVYGNSLNTPLHIAASNGDYASAKAFLEGSKYDSTVSKGTPYHTIAKSVHMHNAQGHTPLHCAIEGRHIEVAQLLFAFDPTCVLDMIGDSQQTAYDRARTRGLHELVELFNTRERTVHKIAEHKRITKTLMTFEDLYN